MEDMTAVADPALLGRERRSFAAATGHWGWRSGHLGRPAPLPHHVVRPALAAAGEVLAMGDQALVQLAGEQRDAVDAGVVAEL